MAFPNPTEIQTAASTLGLDPIEVYAYAAMHGAIPTGNGDIQGFEAQVQNSSPWWTASGSTPMALRYAYIQSHGGLPPTAQLFVNWAQQAGYEDQSGALTGSYPFPGEGYPPGNQPTNPMPSTGSSTSGSASGSAPAAPSGGILSGLNLSGKTIAIGAGVLGVGWYLFGRHR